MFSTTRTFLTRESRRWVEQLTNWVIIDDFDFVGRHFLGWDGDGDASYDGDVSRNNSRDDNAFSDSATTSWKDVVRENGRLFQESFLIRLFFLLL